LSVTNPASSKGKGLESIMAPSHSRTIGSSGRLGGIGALAVGAYTSAQLFLTPGSPARAPTAAPSRTIVTTGTSVKGAESASGRGVSVFPTLVGSTAALVLAGGLAGRRGGLAAVATAETMEVPPPPPPFSPAEQVGALQPLGFFDPLGFTKVGDEEGFRKLRAAELKHGRVAMMASIGALGQHFIRFPGFEKTHGTFGALLSGEGVLGFVVLFVASGILELAWNDDSSREPGNFGDPFGVNMYTQDMRNKEINNGRMAMISVLGIFAAELATGKDAIEQFGLSATRGALCRQIPSAAFVGSTTKASMKRGRALRAVATADVDAGLEAPPPPPPFNPAEQVGAVQPLGFFDPLGFTKVGDEDGFRQLRAAELKHGRVAMMASIGAIGQHFLRFPGFEKAHGTFSAVVTGEGVLGFVVLFAASGVLELAWKDDPSREPGNFGDPFGVNMYTEDMRNKEINNGRMAMISVLGIFAAELATGKDAIEQFGF